MTILAYWRSSASQITAVLVAAAMLVTTLLGAAPVLGQEGAESTPDLDVPIGENAGEAESSGLAQDPVVTPTPVVGSTSGELQGAEPSPEAQESGAAAASQPPAESAGNAASAVPVIAQGLIYLDGGDVIWQVREVELVGAGEAGPVTGNARVILQRSGVSIIRNDVTGKRARLEAGEAYFASAGDPYTAVAEGDSRSIVWVFEISNSNDVGEGAFYLSPNVAAYDEAVYDMEFSRFLLEAGESAEVPQQSGPSLLTVVTGEVSVASGDGEAALSSQDGLVVESASTVTAEGGQAVYVTMAVGPTVSDETAAAAAPADAPAETPDAAATGDSAAGTTTDAAAETETQAEPTEPASDAGGLDPAGDEDSDYATNGDEQAAGLDPYDPDTDGDRILDGQEWAEFGTDPFVEDTDGDGLIDGAEFDTYGTNPAVWDTDGDGAGDGGEVDAGTDPLDPASVP